MEMFKHEITCFMHLRFLYNIHVKQILYWGFLKGSRDVFFHATKKNFFCLSFPRRARKAKKNEKKKSYTYGTLSRVFFWFRLQLITFSPEFEADPSSCMADYAWNHIKQSAQLGCCFCLPCAPNFAPHLRKNVKCARNNYNKYSSTIRTFAEDMVHMTYVLHAKHLVSNARCACLCVCVCVGGNLRQMFCMARDATHVRQGRNIKCGRPTDISRAPALKCGTIAASPN